ncbi:putative ribonuclease H-like domain-containing protein [Tanacetum coccineum]
MLLLLVQGKVTNLSVEERIAFNVSLRMFTRRVVIQRRVEDLQLGVESYQKKLNLTKPDTDGTLDDVRTVLNDRLKGIRMEYLPETFWSHKSQVPQGGIVYKWRRDYAWLMISRRLKVSLFNTVQIRLIGMQSLEDAVADDAGKKTTKEPVNEGKRNGQEKEGGARKEVYVCQPPGFENLQFPNKVYKVEKALYGLHQDPRARCMLMTSSLGKADGIFISQDKYMADILKKFNFVIVKTASTPIETNKALLKDEEAKDVDVYLYRSMIRSLMYLTASRPDIMFAVCACASDYVGASLDRKSTTGGCQFLGKRLISWQCKKQTIVANSTTKAEYVAAANCYGQNLVFHSKTKHIEIRYHFIRDFYEKMLIQVIKIHTDHNVADLLTKAFDVSSDEFGVKTGSCKVNAAKQDLMLLGEMDFLNASTIMYSLTISPTIYASYTEQFWATSKSKIVNNETQIHAKVDSKTIVISESSVRSNLHFNEEDGVASLTNSKILENLALIGYEIVSDKLTFQKASFPFNGVFIHTNLHCLSSNLLLE